LARPIGPERVRVYRTSNSPGALVLDCEDRDDTIEFGSRVRFLLGVGMECQQCHRQFERTDWVASISGSILGDEKTDTYYLCPVCGVYTVEAYWDNFTGEESANVSGPLSKPEGDQAVERIQKCPQPWDKTCRCPAHLAYFRNSLD
jgi:hypothetical protein